MTPNVARMRRRLSLVLLVMTLAIVGSIVRRFGITEVPTGYTCLLPEIAPGDRVLFDRSASQSGPIHAGQIYIFDLPTSSGGTRRIGRILAIPGTQTAIERQTLHLEGLPRDVPPPSGTPLPPSLPESTYLVLTHAAKARGAEDTRRTILVQRTDLVARILLPLGW